MYATSGAPNKDFRAGLVYAITQTPDGYLWIGTEKGLLRFDGFNFPSNSSHRLNGFPRGPRFGAGGRR